MEAVDLESAPLESLATWPLFFPVIAKAWISTPAQQLEPYRQPLMEAQASFPFPGRIFE